jgi:hypothetical protein
MPQPAASPFLSKQRTRIVPYGACRSGQLSVATGDTVVVMVADVQTLAGERSALPASGKPNPGTWDWWTPIGTRLVLHGAQTSALGALEFRVNMATNNGASPGPWQQVAMFPLTLIPISVELTIMAPYVRIDLGALVAGTADWSVTIRGPQ